MTTDLLAIRTTTGARYAAAVDELHTAYVALASIDAALANGASGHGELPVRTFGPTLAQNAGIFAHSVFSEIDNTKDWSIEIATARDALISKL